MNKILLCSLFVSILTVGCSKLDTNSHSTNEARLTEYIEGFELELISFEGEVERYMLTKGLLSGKDPNSLAQLQVWQLLEAHGELEAQDYINNAITIYSFRVKNHPLDNKAGKQQTIISLMVTDDVILGGYSYPDSDEGVYGGPYPLSGVTREWEEVTGMSYLEWIDLWNEKYNN